MPENLELIAARMQSLHEDVTEMKDVLRELTSAITKLAVVEERQAQTSQAMERAFKTIEKIETRLSRLEQMAPITKQTTDWVGKAVWAAAAALIMLVAIKVGVVK